MKIHDISQEVFSCEVYPGDPAPQMTAEQRMSAGSLYNLTSFSMCAHNGTHMDAPFHFYENGKTIEAIALEKTVGPCIVAGHAGMMTADEALAILASASPEAAKRILIKGESVISAEAARVFADAGVYLIGVESQSVGPAAAPMEVHKILLGAETVLLEGIRLDSVAGGEYFLSAAPLSLAGSDGAPCRAILIEF